MKYQIQIRYQLRPSEGAWKKRAACRGLDTKIFFPDRGGDIETPKRICAGCEVREECLEAGTDELYGVWGGTTPRHPRRKALRAASERTYLSA